jgi:Ser/Thr protein kinase RdoA (MazF antagonist)
MQFARKTFGDGCQIIWSAVRRGAVIVRLRVPQQADVAIKCFTTGRDDACKAQGLASSLAVQGARSTARCAAPVLLAVEGPCVAMRWVIGQPLGDKLLRPLYPHKRSHMIAAAGHWLQWFHAGAAQDMRMFDTSYPFERINQFYARVPMRRRDAAFIQAMKCANVHAVEMRTVAVPYGSIHGDFTPYNILYKATCVTGIDFQMQPDRALYLDCIRILVSLHLHRLLPMPRRLVMRSMCEDVRAFMQGYGDEVLVSNPRLLSWLLLVEALRRLASLLSQPLMPWWKPKGIKRSIERRRLRQLVDALVDALQVPKV